MSLGPEDEAVRGAVTRLIAEFGHEPTHRQIAEAAGLGEAAIEPSLRRLHAAHTLLLHPSEPRVWVAHPFALSAGSCWVETARHGYWANCLYCGFGIAVALGCDAVVTTRLGGEAETVAFAICDGAVASGAECLFHLSVPAARWWDNVIYACASFQPFRTASEIDAWCRRHAMPLGHTMTVAELWPFAADWYGDYVDKPWHKRSPGEVQALFARHGLTTPFWRLD